MNSPRCSSRPAKRSRSSTGVEGRKASPTRIRRWALESSAFIGPTRLTVNRARLLATGGTPYFGCFSVRTLMQMGIMNRLSTENRAQIIGCLVEGNSIRATVRMIGAAKNTIVKLLADLGEACAEYQDGVLEDLPAR